jgi:excisionase family DNA binding protein
MTIGELSKKTGVKCHQLRRLIDAGAIPSRRPPGGHRRVLDSSMPEIMKNLAEWGLIEAKEKRKRQ